MHAINDRHVSTCSEAPATLRAESPAISLAGGHEPPVFVDHSGRRAHGVRAVGAVMAGLCALWLAGLVMGMAGFSGFSAAHLPIVGGLSSLARADLASDSHAARVGAVDAVDAKPRSVCLSVGSVAGASTSPAHGTSHKGSGRAVCLPRVRVQHREAPRLT
jgi:hypothetical protein